MRPEDRETIVLATLVWTLTFGAAADEVGLGSRGARGEGQRPAALIPRSVRGRGPSRSAFRNRWPSAWTIS